MKALFFCLVWPEPSSSAAGVRLDYLIRLFIREGFELHLSSTSEQGPYSALYEDLDGVYRHNLDPNSSETSAKLAQINPDVVVFDRYPTEEQFSWHVMEACPKAIRILDTEDLHGLRRARQLTLKELENKGRLTHLYVAEHEIKPTSVYNTIALREMVSMHRSDLSLVVSDVELSYAEKYYGIPTNQLMYLPILSSRLFGQLNNDMSTDACFIGNFKHAPNRDAVHFLRYQLWPHINKTLSGQGDANSECHIYGAYMDATMERLHNPSIGFHMKGRVDDVYSTMAGYGVLLAPLRFGAGVKGKILDAISMELPVVTTPIGSEGLSVHLDGVDFPGYVAKTVEEFKQSAVKCLGTSAQNRWNFPDYKKLVQRLDTEYGNSFIAKVNNLIEGKNRIQHPIKVMLEQNSQLAHRYLSKYIQLKNEG
tara:strand:- start:11119 stop:12387 length:1269 start_codon:yes stop_codon:yes gene_type:complete